MLRQRYFLSYWASCLIALHAKNTIAYNMIETWIGVRISYTEWREVSIQKAWRKQVVVIYVAFKPRANLLYRFPQLRFYENCMVQSGIYRFSVTAPAYHAL